MLVRGGRAASEARKEARPLGMATHGHGQVTPPHRGAAEDRSASPPCGDGTRVYLKTDLLIWMRNIRAQRSRRHGEKIHRLEGLALRAQCTRSASYLGRAFSVRPEMRTCNPENCRLARHWLKMPRFCVALTWCCPTSGSGGFGGPFDSVLACLDLPQVHLDPGCVCGCNSSRQARKISLHSTWSATVDRLELPTGEFFGP